MTSITADYMSVLNKIFILKLTQIKMKIKLSCFKIRYYIIPENPKNFYNYQLSKIFGFFDAP